MLGVIACRLCSIAPLWGLWFVNHRQLSDKLVALESLKEQNVISFDAGGVRKQLKL
ncbi:MAG: hypothetical protein OIF38_08365 [Cellvibrionaceae bacterium]|nr:hypothetical protein [Cellvibrionaceae bacterium]